MKFYNVVESEKIGASVYGIRARTEQDAIEKVKNRTGVICLFAFISTMYGSNMTNRIDLL